MISNKVIDLNPRDRLVSSQIATSVYNKTYLAFIFVLMAACALMGFTISQNHETQKELQDFKDALSVTNVYLAKQGLKTIEVNQ